MGLLPAERQVWLRAYFPCCASCSITGHVHTGRTLNFVPGWMVWYHSNQLSRTCSLVSCRQVFASVTSFYPFTGGNSNLIQLTNNYCSCCMYVHCMYHYACLDQCIQSVHFFSFFFFFAVAIIASGNILYLVHLPAFQTGICCTLILKKFQASRDYNL